MRRPGPGPSYESDVDMTEADISSSLYVSMYKRDYYIHNADTDKPAKLAREAEGPGSGPPRPKLKAVKVAPVVAAVSGSGEEKETGEVRV